MRGRFCCATFDLRNSDSLAEWIGLTVCVRGDPRCTASGAKQPAGDVADSHPLVKSQGAMGRYALTSSTRSNSRGLHSLALGKRTSAHGCIVFAPPWYERSLALDVSSIQLHECNGSSANARYIRISNRPRSRRILSRRSARCHRRRQIRCDGIPWTTSVLRDSGNADYRRGDSTLCVQAGTRKILLIAG